MSKTFTNNGEGRIFVAPADTAVPDTFEEIVAAVTASESKFADIGAIHKDGLTVTPRSVDSSLEDWNGETLAQDISHAWALKAIDFTSVEGVKLAFGEKNVTASEVGKGFKVAYDGDVAELHTLVAIMKDGDKGVAEVLRNGKCDEVGDVSYKKGEYSANDIKMKAVKPSDGGSCCYRVVQGE